MALEQYKSIWLTKKGYDLLREQSVRKGKSLAQALDEVIELTLGKKPNRKKKDIIDKSIDIIDKSIDKSINISESVYANVDKETHPRVPEVIKLFEVVNPSVGMLYGNPPQRAACERLLKILSMEEMKFLVQQVLPVLNADQYAKGKSITPTEFERNLGFIRSYMQSLSKPKMTGLEPIM